jgi:hypothetical protein
MHEILESHPRAMLPPGLPMEPGSNIRFENEANKTSSHSSSNESRCVHLRLMHAAKISRRCVFPPELSGLVQ